MTLPPLAWPQSAGALLEQAKQGGEQAKLIMAGTLHVESWLIENRILPLLRAHQLATLRFETGDQRSADLLLLPDGSAFARNTGGRWLVLDKDEALHEIQHIGSRFAPGDHWQQGFAALIQPADDAPVACTPLEVAKFWEKITGSKPRGFEVGSRDELEAFGLGFIDKMLHMQNRLGL